MKPETVLALKNGDDPKTVLDEWINEYDAIATEFTACEDICKKLKSRAIYAAKLYKERTEYIPSPCHDEAYYEEFAENREKEDASLDGEFPLGSEKDAAFANCYFSVSELAKIQCGLHHLISSGDFDGYNFDALVRKGFIAEMRENWQEAVRCYEGVSTSESVQNREYECRRRWLADESDLRPVREILQEQIENGDIDAIWQMAQLCKAENEPEQAAEWFNKAIEAGQIDALLSAAMVYLNENGGFYNAKLAGQYLRRAADGGSIPAIIALGDLELENTDIPFWQQAAQLRDLEYPDRKPKRKVRNQHKKQMAWYRLAAEAGDTNAMNALSMACHLGYPENRDDEQAFLWASRGADCGDGSAMYQTAYLYENGFGTDRDVDAALLLYTEAAEQGVRSAMIRLYEIYTNGLLHIRPDGKKAARYLFLSGEGRD